MVATRVFRTCRTVQMDLSSVNTSPSLVHPTLRFPVRASGFDRRTARKCTPGGDPMKTAIKAAFPEAVVVDRRTKKGAVDLRELLADVVAAVEAFKLGFRRKSWKLNVERVIEKFIFDFRFSTLIAVVGSLMGSMLCFAEGCYMILQASTEYFHAMWQRTDQGQTVIKLMDAIDMFLFGIAMLVFGVALYDLFVRPRPLKQNQELGSGSNLFGLFHLKARPQWVEMESVTEIKTSIGHAVVMILHVGVLDKFQNVSIANAMDLACFAGAILVSSACVFLLSRLVAQRRKSES